jgi:YidC/Oxa1 family membrane protein insertase
MFKDLFDKNTLLGIALIFLMVAGYFYFSKKKIETLRNEQQIQNEFEKKSTDTNPADTTVQNIVPTPANIVISDTTDIQSPIDGQPLTIENELIKLQINTHGACIYNAELKHYKSFEKGQVEFLIDSSTHWNYTLQTNQGSFSTKNTLFNVRFQSKDSIVLEANNGVKLSYALHPNSYVVSQKWTVPNASKTAQHKLSLETQMNRQEVNLDRERMYSTIYFLPQGEELAKSLDKSKNESLTETNPMKWVSFGQQFFTVSILPTQGISNAAMNSYYMADDNNYVKKYKLEAALAPSETLSINYFIGPADYKMLKKLDQNLELIVPLSQDFILFRWMKIFNIYLIIPFFDFLSKFLSNYGLIILIMTILIKIITAPLSYKTYKSGVAMKILKPELEKLKAKHGNDQQKYAQEQMKIFNEVGVSPLGGCLPMLLQMPILFAMFSFFPSCVSLRQQPFLWAHDLSTYDNILNLPFSIPLYGSHVSLFALLTALTQVVTTVYAQRLQPSSPQADQMKIMTYTMPVVFLFMFNSFPAALTFYYFIQNILSVIQQWFFTTFIIKEDVVREEMALAKKTPKKQSGFQKKMAEIMTQAEEQKKIQQKSNKK